jgi:hypothetical protein
LADENRKVKVMTEAMAAKASAIGIDELRTVTAKPTASPTAAEMAIWRHLGEIVSSLLREVEVTRFDGFALTRFGFMAILFNVVEADFEVVFIGAPISSLV